MLLIALLVAAWLAWRLPRALGRRAFAAMRWSAAARWYTVASLLALRGVTRSSYRVSLAACQLGRGRAARAERLLEHVERKPMLPATRAAWNNLKAYAMVRTEPAGDLALALALVDEALRLRPSVHGFRHTRAVILLAMGRVDEATTDLEQIWGPMGGDEAPPHLRAERAWDLGCAWAAKGEGDYADDYWALAHRAAPESPWAAKARAKLQLRSARRPTTDLAL
jgi:tetratricopeptide (TPR) repeat protein